MTGQHEKPDFVIDPSGNVQDIRHERHATSQSPHSEPTGNGRDNQPNPPSQKPKKTLYLIPIPVGLIFYLLLTLFRHFSPPNANVNTFDSESAYNAFQSGNYDFFRGEYDKAIMHYNMALSSESDVGDVYNGRGLAYQAKEDHDRALADFDQALELMPKSAMVYNNRALSYYAMVDYEQAIADLNKAIEIQANFGKAHYNRGITYYAMGDYDQAIADLSKAVELSSNWHAPPTDYGSDPEHDLFEVFDTQMEAMQSYTDLPSVYHSRGLAYLAKEEYDSAISDLDMAISLQPDLSVAYYTRAAAYLSAGNHDEAKADCQTALELGSYPEVQPLGEEVQTLCSLVVSGYDFSFSTNGEVPTKAASDAQAEELLASPIAMYIPQPNETPTTPIWDSTQASCDGKPLSKWGSSGIYHYRQAGEEYLVIEKDLNEQGSVNTTCENILSPFCNFGELFTEPPVVGNSMNLSSQYCSLPAPATSISCNNSIIIAEKGLIRTSLETFQAFKVDTILLHSFTTGPHHNYDIRGNKSEWYACGYGLIYSTASSTETKDGITLNSKSSELTLVSFTPFSTNESHVRYILADTQLGNLADTYRGNITDEETAESLRRWDAGIRVENIDEFELKIVNEQWQIVYAGTENTVIGIDVILNSDLPH